MAFLSPRAANCLARSFNFDDIDEEADEYDSIENTKPCSSKTKDSCSYSKKASIKRSFTLSQSLEDLGKKESKTATLCEEVYIKEKTEFNYNSNSSEGNLCTRTNNSTFTDQSNSKDSRLNITEDSNSLIESQPENIIESVSHEIVQNKHNGKKFVKQANLKRNSYEENKLSIGDTSIDMMPCQIFTQSSSEILTSPSLEEMTVNNSNIISKSIESEIISTENQELEAVDENVNDAEHITVKNVKINIDPKSPMKLRGRRKVEQAKDVPATESHRSSELEEITNKTKSEQASKIVRITRRTAKSHIIEEKVPDCGINDQNCETYSDSTSSEPESIKIHGETDATLKKDALDMGTDSQCQQTSDKEWNSKRTVKSQEQEVTVSYTKEDLNSGIDGSNSSEEDGKKLQSKSVVIMDQDFEEGDAKSKSQEESNEAASSNKALEQEVIVPGCEMKGQTIESSCGNPAIESRKLRSRTITVLKKHLGEIETDPKCLQASNEELLSRRAFKSQEQDTKVSDCGIEDKTNETRNGNSAIEGRKLRSRIITKKHSEEIETDPKGQQALNEELSTGRAVKSQEQNVTVPDCVMKDQTAATFSDNFMEQEGQKLQCEMVITSDKHSEEIETESHQAPNEERTTRRAIRSHKQEVRVPDFKATDQPSEGGSSNSSEQQGRQLRSRTVTYSLRSAAPKSLKVNPQGFDEPNHQCKNGTTNNLNAFQSDSSLKPYRKVSFEVISPIIEQCIISPILSLDKTLQICESLSNEEQLTFKSIDKSSCSNKGSPKKASLEGLSCALATPNINTEVESKLTSHKRQVTKWHQQNSNDSNNQENPGCPDREYSDDDDPKTPCDLPSEKMTNISDASSQSDSVKSIGNQELVNTVDLNSLGNLTCEMEPVSLKECSTKETLDSYDSSPSPKKHRKSHELSTPQFSKNISFATSTGSSNFSSSPLVEISNLQMNDQVEGANENLSCSQMSGVFGLATEENKSLEANPKCDMAENPHLATVADVDFQENISSVCLDASGNTSGKRLRNRKLIKVKCAEKNSLAIDKEHLEGTADLDMCTNEADVSINNETVTTSDIKDNSMFCTTKKLSSRSSLSIRVNFDGLQDSNRSFERDETMCSSAKDASKATNINKSVTEGSNKSNLSITLTLDDLPKSTSSGESTPSSPDISLNKETDESKQNVANEKIVHKKKNSSSKSKISLTLKVDGLPITSDLSNKGKMTVETEMNTTGCKDTSMHTFDEVSLIKNNGQFSFNSTSFPEPNSKESKLVHSSMIENVNPQSFSTKETTNVPHEKFGENLTLDSDPCFTKPSDQINKSVIIVLEDCLKNASDENGSIKPKYGMETCISIPQKAPCSPDYSIKADNVLLESDKIEEQHGEKSTKSPEFQSLSSIQRKSQSPATKKAVSPKRHISPLKRIKILFQNDSSDNAEVKSPEKGKEIAGKTTAELKSPEKSEEIAGETSARDSHSPCNLTFTVPESSTNSSSEESSCSAYKSLLHSELSPEYSVSQMEYIEKRAEGVTENIPSPLKESSNKSRLEKEFSQNKDLQNNPLQFVSKRTSSRHSIKSHQSEESKSNLPTDDEELNNPNELLNNDSDSNWSTHTYKATLPQWVNKSLPTIQLICENYDSSELSNVRCAKKISDSSYKRRKKLVKKKKKDSSSSRENSIEINSAENSLANNPKEITIPDFSPESQSPDMLDNANSSFNSESPVKSICQSLSPDLPGPLHSVHISPSLNYQSSEKLVERIQSHESQLISVDEHTSTSLKPSNYTYSPVIPSPNKKSPLDLILDCCNVLSCTQDMPHADSNCIEGVSVGKSGNGSNVNSTCSHEMNKSLSEHEEDDSESSESQSPSINKSKWPRTRRNPALTRRSVSKYSSKYELAENDSSKANASVQKSNESSDAKLADNKVADSCAIKETSARKSVRKVTRTSKSIDLGDIFCEYPINSLKRNEPNQKGVDSPSQEEDSSNIKKRKATPQDIPSGSSCQKKRLKTSRGPKRKLLDDASYSELPQHNRSQKKAKICEIKKSDLDNSSDALEVTDSKIDCIKKLFQDPKWLANTPKEEIVKAVNDFMKKFANKFQRHVKRIKKLNIDEDWDMPPLHKTCSQLKRDIHDDLPRVTGKITDKEKEYIKQRWSQFCQMYSFNVNRPEYFMVDYQCDNTIKMGWYRLKMISFFKFIAQDMPGRSIPWTSRAFSTTLSYHKKGDLTAEELRVIPIILQAGPGKPVLAPAKVGSILLQRKKDVFFLRASNMSPASKGIWNMHVPEKWKLIGDCLKNICHTDLSNINHISDSKWEELEQMSGINRHQAKAIWLAQLQPMFVLSNLGSEFSKKELLEMIIDAIEEQVDVTSLEDIDWLKVSADLFHLSPLFLFCVFFNCVQQLVPRKKQHQLTECLTCLKRSGPTKIKKSVLESAKQFLMKIFS